jgi:hypothetical protein
MFSNPIALYVCLGALLPGSIWTSHASPIEPRQATPTVFLIRHGEKPDTGDGLSAQGEQRAQCLRQVFGANSPYNVGYIMAEKPKKGD